MTSGVNYARIDIESGYKRGDRNARGKKISSGWNPGQAGWAKGIRHYRGTHWLGRRQHFVPGAKAALEERRCHGRRNILCPEGMLSGISGALLLPQSAGGDHSRKWQRGGAALSLAGSGSANGRGADQPKDLPHRFQNASHPGLFPACRIDHPGAD